MHADKLPLIFGFVWYIVYSHKAKWANETKSVDLFYDKKTKSFDFILFLLSFLN
jgi:hypothetical protein